MSHILEEELHAYLDQALSRSRCVVIESHLASCGFCSSQRDAIAALRDQTTAPARHARPARRIPPFARGTRAAAGSRAQPRRQRTRRALWAASLVGALGLGYGLRSRRIGVPCLPTVATALAAATRRGLGRAMPAGDAPQSVDSGRDAPGRPPRPRFDP